MAVNQVHINGSGGNDGANTLAMISNLKSVLQMLKGANDLRIEVYGTGTDAEKDRFAIHFGITGNDTGTTDADKRTAATDFNTRWNNAVGNLHASLELLACGTKNS